MISALMVVTSLAMFAFPKQLRGNRIPSPHQSIDAQKTPTKVEVEEPKPKLKGWFSYNRLFFMIERES